MNVLAWVLIAVFIAAYAWMVIQVERFGAKVKKSEPETYERLNKVKRGWASRYLVVYHDAEVQLKSPELIAEAKRLRRNKFVLFGLMPIMGLVMGYILFLS